MTVTDHDTPPVDDEYITNFARRILQDALSEATADYWHRRADTFDWVCGHTNHPRDTPRCTRMADTADACRNAAHAATWTQP